MTVDELIESLSRELPWGRHLYSLDIPGLSSMAFKIVDFDLGNETVRVCAVGDNHIREHSIQDLDEIHGDVCSCGELNCEWHGGLEDE